MEALFRKVLEKTQPFTDSKTLLKIPKLTPMVRLKPHLPRIAISGQQSVSISSRDSEIPPTRHKCTHQGAQRI